MCPAICPWMVSGDTTLAEVTIVASADVVGCSSEVLKFFTATTDNAAAFSYFTTVNYSNYFQFKKPFDAHTQGRSYIQRFSNTKIL